MWREKVERGTEGLQGQGQCQQRQHRDEGPGLETKIIRARSGSFRKLKKVTREISTVGLREWRRKRKELSVCLFGRQPLRNNYSLLITIWRKELQSSGLGSLLCLLTGKLVWCSRCCPDRRARRPRTRQAMLSPFARHQTGEHTTLIRLQLHFGQLGWHFVVETQTLWQEELWALSRGRGGRMKVTALEVNLDLMSHRG